MSIVNVDLTAMFSHREPWDCSNSDANLGPNAGPLTWACALEVASNHEAWLLIPLEMATAYTKDWARDAGAWEEGEIAEWSEVEALALLVQNVASDLRTLGSDNAELSELVGRGDESVNLYVYLEGERVLGELCA